jgi:hypothetical protein
VLDLRFKGRGCRILNCEMNRFFRLEVDEIDLFVAGAIVVVFRNLSFFQKRIECLELIEERSKGTVDDGSLMFHISDRGCADLSAMSGGTRFQVESSCHGRGRSNLSSVI